MPEDNRKYEDHPLVWFGEMLVCYERGDFTRAAECQAELARLGWRVGRNPRRKPHTEGGVS